MQTNQIVSRDEWLAAQQAHLAREKQYTHLRDALNTERQALPWVKVDKQYVFETPDGQKSLSSLFGNCSQLVVYHFMFGPEWKAGCTGCSFLADHLDGTLPHLEHHDVSLIAVSRAPLAKIMEYKTRMGWQFPWVSSFGSDFNRDHQVSFTKDELETGRVYYNFADMDSAKANDELPGLSAFFKNKNGEIYHTHSSYARGAEEIIGTFMILDRAPLGRNESKIMDWVRRHDEYEDTVEAKSSGSA
jgi:predicted dithiol-disulfide oxidoreductase (DUF899 family)